jgi:large subunit ribosomal protein L18
MNDRVKKRTNRTQREKRTRAKIHGTSNRPRLSVKISNVQISAQIINDDLGVTLAHATTFGIKNSQTMSQKATLVGELIAKNALKKKIKYVVFDRGAKIYHGRVKALAEAARKNGLEF